MGGAVTFALLLIATLGGILVVFCWAAWRALQTDVEEIEDILKDQFPAHRHGAPDSAE